MTIWLDMDGTFVDLYGVENWLDKLVHNDPSPYITARPLVNLSVMARYLNKLRRAQVKVGIVSWLSKNSNSEYDMLVTDAKREWLARHLPSVEFDYIDILSYGTPKGAGRTGILFDDEERNREQWTGEAYDVGELLENLGRLVRLYERG